MQTIQINVIFVIKSSKIKTISINVNKTLVEHIWPVRVFNASNGIMNNLGIYTNGP